MKIYSSQSHAFTLLEVMIAMAIMLVAFASILMVERSSLNTTAKAKQMNVVGMLARNAMAMTETEITGKTFTEIQEETAGQFEPPFQDYTYVRKVKEIEFPNISALFQGGEDKDSAQAQNAEPGADAMQEQMGKVIFNYLSKAIREVTITIKWKRGAGEQNYTVAMYWVDFETPFSITP
ncbi:MAG: type II secretion system protein [Proteobacteria bacterium]|nr:MAG: type II secretion system protein [Pseudomonadota bacterium]